MFARRAAFELERNKQFSKVSEAEKSFKSVFNGFNDIVLIQDADYKIIEANDTTILRLGYRKDEILGRTPVFLSKPGHNKLDIIFRKFNKAFQGIPQKADFWFQTVRDEVFPVEIAMQKGVYFGEQVVFSIAREITERHAIEQALKASKDQYQSLFEGLYDAIFILERSSLSVKDCNIKAVELFEYETKDQINRLHFSSFVFNPHNVAMDQDLNEIIQTIGEKQKHSLILTCQTAKGHRFDSEVTLLNFYEPEEDQILILVRNISQQVQAKLDLKRQHEFLP